MTQPADKAGLSINHVAISVPDCESAAQWYAKVFSMRPLGPVIHIKRSQMPDGPIFKIYGDALEEFKIVWLVGADLAGIEIFEFIRPSHEVSDGPEFAYHRAGFFHMALTAPDVAEAVRLVVDEGGKSLGDVQSLPKGNRCAYVLDPWGNAIEILDDHFEAIVGNGT